MHLHSRRGRGTAPLLALFATLLLAAPLDAQDATAPVETAPSEEHVELAPTEAHVEAAPSEEHVELVPSEEHVGAAQTAEPAAAPAPPAPLFSTVLAGVPIRLTGTVHAMVELTQGVQSFDSPTAVAPTSALNPAVLAAPDDANLSFQVQQTRLGMILGEGTPFRGQVEIDFVHFDQSSPTVQAFPRVRIASLEWQYAPNQRVFLGQTWDLFGNAIGPQLLSHSFNLVGTLFRAGNIGFMRQQLGWSLREGDVEIAVAAGLQGANTGPAFNNIEESLTPTGSARVMLHVGESSVIGMSGIGTALRFTSGTMPIEYRPAFGGQLFADLALGPLSLHAEVYLAQNLANTGALNLGFGRYGHDVADAGGYVSGRLTLGDHALTAMFGVAAVLDPNEVVPGYTPANPTGVPPTTVGTATPATGPGIVHNLSGHVGYWLSPLRGLSLVVEPYFYVTRFRLDPADATRLSADRFAFGVMLGSMFQF